MVKLKGPGLAQTAAGGLGKTLIFAQSKGRPYVKKWHQPKNPKTNPQLAIRAITAFLSQQWAALSQANQQTWEALASLTNIPPYNAWLAVNITRWRSFLAPSKAYPATQTGSGGTTTNRTAVVNIRRVTLSWEPLVLSQNWGYVCRIRNGGTPPIQWDYTRAFILGGTTGTKTVTLYNLQPGSYGWRLDSFTATGALTGISEGGSFVIP
jgi:hypothetical protein